MCCVSPDGGVMVTDPCGAARLSERVSGVAGGWAADKGAKRVGRSREMGGVRC